MKSTILICLYLCLGVALNAQTVSNSKIPLQLENFYQDNNYLWKPSALIDGNLTENFNPAWTLLYSDYELTVDLLDYTATVKKVRLFDGAGASGLNTRLYLVRKDNNQEVYLGTFTGNAYNAWAEFTPPADFVASRLLIRGQSGPVYGTELEVIADYTVYHAPTYSRPKKTLKNMFGVNTFWWDLMKNDVQYSTNTMYSPKYNRVKEMGISMARFYIDHRQLQPDSAVWAFSPTLSDFYTDELVAQCVADGIEPLLTLQGNPPHVYNTYPDANPNDNDHPGQSTSPVIFSDLPNRKNVSVYAGSAKLGFVVAARYGRNSNIPDYLLETPRPGPVWYVPNNTIRKGLGTVRYIEIGNELELGWPDTASYMTGQMLAPFLSAIYDGHMGTLGPGYGIKTADPTMQVVVPGFGRAATDGYRAIVDWSRKNRGYNPDGSVNLPFDVINYHKYSSDGGLDQYGISHIGMPPELSRVLDIADEFIDFSNKYARGREVWLSEWGYDYHPQSQLRASAIGSHPVQEVIGAWAARSILGYSARGIDRMHWFKLYNNYEGNGTVTSTQFNSMSLLADDHKENGTNSPAYPRRTIGDYYAQMKELQDYTFDSYIANSAMQILKFTKGNMNLFAIWHVENTSGTDGNRSFTEVTGTYPLPFPGDPLIMLKKLVPGQTQMDSTEIQVTNGTYSVSYGLTPVFIKTTAQMSVVLPVEFVSVTADCYEDSTRVTWRTGEVANLDHFEVQSSSDGTNWTAQKQTKDQQCFVRSSRYYRVVGVDRDGKRSFSKVVASGCALEEASLYPNPVRDHLTVEISSPAAVQANLSIRNAKGALILSRKVALNAGLNRLALDLALQTPGAYMLILQTPSGSRSCKLLKR